MNEGYAYEHLLVRRFFASLDTGEQSAVDAAYNEYRAYIDFLKGSGKERCYNWHTEGKIDNIYRSAQAVWEE